MNRKANFVVELFAFVLISFILAILFAQGKCEAKPKPYAFALKLCDTKPDLYTCRKIQTTKEWRKKKGRWFYSWEEMFPNKEYRKLVMTINRRNTILWKGHWIALPKHNPPLHFLNYSPLPLRAEYEGKTIVVDLNVLALGAYEGGKLVRWDIAIGGKKWKRGKRYLYHTHPGEWTVLKKGSYRTRSNLYPVSCQNKKVCGFWMAWAIFWHKDGTAIHFSKVLSANNESHGCVRSTMETAKFLNKWSEVNKTKVIIKEY